MTATEPSERPSPAPDPSQPSEPTPSPALSDKPARASALPPDQRRASIIEATTALIREHGRNITTRQIADAAGIAEGTIFRVFDTKDDLIDAAVARALDLTETIEKLQAIDTAEALEDKVRQCAVILIARLESVVELMIAIHKKSRDDPHRRHHGPPPKNNRHAEILAAVAAVVEPDAQTLSMTPQRAAHVLWLLVFGGTHRKINDGDPLTADDVTGILLHGITRPADSTADALPCSGSETH